ncbi:Rhodanese-like domain protein [Geobacillus proteiniphilus]|uniref:Rhodanese-like domain protein n=1 Tax=Geobacillus proteiniphilus TaxID=860353 RepID=A0A1Q5T7V3_9BACL|nr:rhodanese-like domain-containing protein [Geobacillus proteiniphilus]OKO96304.1 Rhodanese-like domain protein [Geobacillus proteiniphilus]
MKTITPKEVEEQLRAGELLHIIDVREPDEVATGKIPGAINIPLSLIGFRMHELDKNEEYILVCRSGGRSGRAAEFLDSRGYRVVNMTGGMLAWEGPVE